jgi:hypothetical protein
LLLASLPPGFPRNPNVLLIRTHPNPFPSVGYRDNRRKTKVVITECYHLGGILSLPQSPEKPRSHSPSRNV